MNWETRRVDRLVDRWPIFASELRAALLDADERALADDVDDMVVVQVCGCGDDFCRSFYTAPPPDGTWGPGHRNISLSPPWPGMLVLDVVDGSITYVEVSGRPRPLD
ncbi:hypothetical protein [Cellulomonas massiliensis]|uniref:hypothetical protein n=1 Tax=Cellulomonas massiliensis TaxID=1465811 RepID=UPI000361DFD6|nr:hypothetical protein [Cellulomonas massiliensis]